MSALNDVRDILRGVIASFFGFGGRLIARGILMICAGRIFGIEALGHLGQVAALSEIAAAIFLSAIWWIVFSGDIALMLILAIAVPAMTFTDVTLTATKFKRIIRWDVTVFQFVVSNHHKKSPNCDYRHRYHGPTQIGSVCLKLLCRR